MKCLLIIGADATRVGSGGRVDAALGGRMTVHFVGAGPGAADLLTVRATRLLAAADLVLYPGTYLDPEVLGHCSPAAALVDTHDLDLDQITERLVRGQRAGQQVVRLTSGDPSLYSALFEQTRRLDEAGVAWDVTPGVRGVRRSRRGPGARADRPAGDAVGGPDQDARPVDGRCPRPSRWQPSQRPAPRWCSTWRSRAPAR